MSRNPFLSTFEAEFNKEARKTDLIDMSATMKASPKKDTFSNGSAAEELFVRYFLFAIAAGKAVSARASTSTLHPARDNPHLAGRARRLRGAMPGAVAANTRHECFSSFVNRFADYP